MITKFAKLQALLFAGAMALTPVLAFAADTLPAAPATTAADAAKPVQPVTKAPAVHAGPKSDNKLATVKPEVKTEGTVKTDTAKIAPIAPSTKTGTQTSAAVPAPTAPSTPAIAPKS